jgi:hypothetical protein
MKLKIQFNKGEFTDLLSFFHQIAEFITDETKVVLLAIEPSLEDENFYAISAKYLQSKDGDNDVVEVDQKLSINMHHHINKSNIITISRKVENVSQDVRHNSAYFTISTKNFKNFIPLVENGLSLPKINNIYLVYAKDSDGKNAFKVFTDDIDDYFEAWCIVCCLKRDRLFLTPPEDYELWLSLPNLTGVKRCLQTTLKEKDGIMENETVPMKLFKKDGFDFVTIKFTIKTCSQFLHGVFVECEMNPNYENKIMRVDYMCLLKILTFQEKYKLLCDVKFYSDDLLLFMLSSLPGLDENDIEKFKHLFLISYD